MRIFRRHSSGAIRLSALLAAVMTASMAATSGGVSGAKELPRSTGSLFVAEPAGFKPDYILPLTPGAHYSITNVNQLQLLMFRRLYWLEFPSATSAVPTIGTLNSLASAPSYSDGYKRVTINLKDWKFANGERANARALKFFLNLYDANKVDYYNYEPGFGIPDEVASVTTPTATQVVITFKHSVNPLWATYDMLAPLVPLPISWDVHHTGGAAGSGGCSSGAWGTASTISKCRAVYNFLSLTADVPSTFASSFWNVPDGPWKLLSVVSGTATFEPNVEYSGTTGPHVGLVVLVPFSTVGDEVSALGAGTIQLGYLEDTTAPCCAAGPGLPGPQLPSLVGKYTLETGPPEAFSPTFINFASSDPKLAEVKQLYLREALEAAIDQTGLITTQDRGYGYPSCGPVPPTEPFLTCNYHYSSKEAESLLTSHGWTDESGTDVCTNAGSGTSQCGAGIAPGTQLKLRIATLSGDAITQSLIAAEITEWAAAGISVTDDVDSSSTILSACVGSVDQLCIPGRLYDFDPDGYPTGEDLFTPNGTVNWGDVHDATLNSLVDATVNSPSTNLHAYATYAAQNFPDLYQPDWVHITEISTSLVASPNSSVPNPLAQDPIGDLAPENLRY